MPSIRLPAAALVLALLVSLVPDSVRAQAREADVLPSLGTPTTSLVSIGAPSRTPRWRGGILLDESFRSAFRLASVPEQEIARTISDVLLVSTIASAMGVSAIGAPLAQEDGGLLWRAAFSHTVALGVTMALGEAVKHATSRARPFERECAEDPTRHGCDDGDLFASFYSLHSGMAFTSAGFACAMHGAKDLFGDGAADAVACGASLALASTTALLRVLADRHYLSDVLVGAVLGFAVGFLVPLALVPSRDERLEGPPQGNVEVPAGTGMIGLTFSGEF